MEFDGSPSLTCYLIECFFHLHSPTEVRKKNYPTKCRHESTKYARLIVHDSATSDCRIIPELLGHHYDLLSPDEAINITSTPTTSLLPSVSIEFA